MIGSARWWGVALLEGTGYFALRKVEVEGAKYLAPDSIVAALALPADASVFANRDDLAARIAAMPGIASVEVRRRLPGTLVVSVIETEPVALAEGPEGLVAIGPSGRPLPYDPLSSRVDVPLVRDANPELAAALLLVQQTDPTLFADVAAARATDGGIALDFAAGRIRLLMPIDPDVVLSVAAVRRDLAARDVRWRELDGRFRGWVVVRRPAA